MGGGAEVKCCRRHLKGESSNSDSESLEGACRRNLESENSECCHSRSKTSDSCRSKGGGSNSNCENAGNKSCHCHSKSKDSTCCHSKGEGSCCRREGEANKKDSHACGCCGSSKERKAGTCGCCATKRKGLLSEKAALLISLAALVVSFLIDHKIYGFSIPWLGFPLTDPAWIAVILCGLPLAKSALSTLIKERKITAGILISTAMLAAILLQFAFVLNPELAAGHGHSSYIFAAGEIAFLMALGEILEEMTVRKSRSGIESLLKLSPQKALRKNGERLEEIEASQISVGDTLLVRPYTTIPADGEVTRGSSSVNQANLTGESAPVEKSPGDEVLAGTINLESEIEIVAKKDSSQSAIAKMIELVKEAEGKRAPIARIADKWASYIVPAAIFTAFAVGFFAYFALGKGALESATRGVTILVVFCPCALVLATPTAIAAGIGNAARRGILVKSAAALEELGRVNIFAFDKTGTITEGKIEVSGIIPAKGFEEKEVLRLALCAEQTSNHPIAEAVKRRAAALKIEAPSADNAKVLAGFGVECRAGEKLIQVGRPSESELAELNLAGAALETLAAIRVNSKLAGLISFSDSIKPDAKRAIADISKSARCVMLTGDNRKSASAVAKLAGIDEFMADMLPDEKLRAIEKLKREGRVCMVGDGVNDAPSLAAADCSISMGSLASDVAIESAGIALMNDKLSSVSGIFRFSKRVVKTIKLNIALSMLVNLAAVIFAAFGILNPVSGAIWHNLASVMVVLNSARLIGHKKSFE